MERALGLVNKHQVGQDWRTHFQRLKEKRFNGDHLRFTNPVMMSAAGKVQGRVREMVRWLVNGSAVLHGRAIVMMLPGDVMVRARSTQPQTREVTQEMVGFVSVLVHKCMQTECQ